MLLMRSECRSRTNPLKMPTIYLAGAITRLAIRAVASLPMASNANLCVLCLPHTISLYCMHTIDHTLGSTLSARLEPDKTLRTFGQVGYALFSER